jgi:hypothetical protein
VLDRVPPTGVELIDDVVAEATGRGERVDPVAGRSGGPAGNARLTAWTGLVLLVLVPAELVTLVDVNGLMDWHLGLGLAVAAFALVKVGSTAWRFAGYYLRRPAYHRAGPPPLLLRLLGPVLVAATVALLASGVVLAALGPDRSRQLGVSLLGLRVDLVTVHQGSFAVFAVAAGLHVVGRLVPALGLSTARGRRSVDRWAGRPPAPAAERVPADRSRVAVLVLAAVAAVLAVVLLLPTAAAWQHGSSGEHGPHALDDRRPPG